MKMSSTSRNRANLWFGRPMATIRVAMSALIAILVIVQRNQFQITRQLPVSDVPVATHQIIQTNVSKIDHLTSSVVISKSNKDTSVSDVPTVTTTSTGSTVTTVSSTVYKLPNKPLHNIDSILKRSIGASILRNSEKNPLLNCSPTVQFQLKTTIQQIHNIDVFEYTIQSMMMDPQQSRNDNNNTQRPINIIPKRSGGDEIYVEWVSSSEDIFEMGVAMITDERDGTYTLKFVRPPILQQSYTKRPIERTQKEQLGTMTIYYDYTCGIGSIFAPQKDRYRRAGEVHLSFNHSNVRKPYIHDFVPPNTAVGIGTEESAIDLSKYHTVIAFGDSLMLQLVRRYQMGGFWSPNIRYEENINQCLSTSNDAEMAIQKFHQWHRRYILDVTATNQNQTVAVIIGSAVWDAMRGCVRSDFIDHRSAIRQFVTTLRTRYPQIHLYWKSPSAILLHRRRSLEELMDNKVWLDRSRYISDGVPRRIYEEQKSLMEELGVPFLDLFDAYYLSAPWSLPGDARHYEDNISFLLLSYYWPGLNVTNVYYQ